MTNELLEQRRTLLKKRFRTSMLQLYVVFAITAYNCVAELVIPSFVLPVSFYLPQFISSYAKFLSNSDGNRTLFVFLVILAFAILLFIGFCLIFARKIYKLMNAVTVTASIDMILLIYIGISGLLVKGLQLFFLINLFAHVWILYLSVTACRSSEGLEVLPEADAEAENSN